MNESAPALAVTKTRASRPEGVSMEQGSDKIYLKWAHRFHRQEVAAFDSLEEAVSDAKAASDAGSESFDYIEGPDGIVPSPEVGSIWDALDEEETVTYNARVKPTHRILLTTPTGEGSAVVAWATDEHDAVRKAASWSSRYGPRVSVSEVH